jgi:hypothetical protein
LIKILGIGLPEFITRLGTAVLYGFISLVFFLVIPNFLLSGPASGLGISTTLFFDYAILIVILSGMQGVFRGKYLGDAATVANGFVQIYYLLLITNGGFFSYFEQQAGITLSIDFHTIVYLFLIPSTLSIINAIVHAASRTSIQPSQTTNEFIRL